MIVDTLEHLLQTDAAELEKLGRGLRFLQETDFSGQAAGRHEVDGDLFYFLNEYETKPTADCFWEAHRTFLDVHYILEGTEQIGYAPIGQLEVKEEYSAEKDAVFFNGAVKSYVTAPPGTVVICYPQDGHMTGIASGSREAVRKVVLKIRL